MAKKSTVFYKLPVEDMRGKLATKQQQITYAGQQAGETPYDLTAGKKEATNFEKYIVLTKRRGVNRFYVKSRVAVNNTTAMVAAKAALGAASSIALRVVNAFLNAAEQTGGLVVDRITAATSYYNQQNGTNLTNREYVAKFIVPQLRNRRGLLTCPDVPDPDAALTPVISLGHNTFVDDSSYSAASDVATGFPGTGLERAAFRKFMGMLSPHGDGVVLKMQTISGQVGDEILGTQIFDVNTGRNLTGLTAVTISNHAVSSFGAAYHMSVPADVEEVHMSLYDKKGAIVASGCLYKKVVAGETVTYEKVAPSEHFSNSTEYFVGNTTR